MELKSYMIKKVQFQNPPKNSNINLNVSIVQQNLPCKIYIGVAFIFMNLLLNIDMNVSIAQKNPSCKICINVAFNLYKFAFKYRYECKHCSEKPSNSTFLLLE